MTSTLEDEQGPSSYILDVTSFLNEVALKCRERQASKISRFDGCKYFSINPPTDKRQKHTALKNFNCENK